ncbi:MAG TPA: MFS transporter [Terriglobales bacterium]|nr:MFS transporter [Terriglobales bacterium]
MSAGTNTRAMSLSAAVIFLYGTIASLLGTLLPSLSSNFHLTPAQNGYLAAVQAIGLTLATLIAGPLMDSKGIKLTLSSGLALLLVSLLALVTARDWLMLMASIFILGIGSGMAVAAANTLASEVDESKRTAMVNFANIFFGLGGLATPFVAANLLAGNPMRLAYLVAALTVAGLLFGVSTAMPAGSGQGGFHITAIARIERRWLLLVLCAVNFLYAGSEVGFWNWLPKYLMSRGNDQRTALNILGFGFACGMIVGRLLAMQILRRASAIAVCIAGSLAMIVTTFATIHLANPALATIAVFCSGVAMGPVFPSTIGITGDAFRRMTATCIGLVITCGWFGAALTSWLIGRIAGSDPRRLSQGLLVIPLSALFIVVLSFAVRRMLSNRQPVTPEPVVL